MWQYLPKTCSSRQCLTSSRSFLYLLMRNWSHIRLQHLEGGSLVQKSSLIRLKSSRSFATQVKPEKSQSYLDFSSNLSESSSNGFHLAEDFGSLSVNDVDLSSSFASSENPSFLKNAQDCVVPTTVSRSNNLLAVSVQNYFESLEGYDIPELLFDFSEATSDQQYSCSSHWFSALQKSSDHFSKKKKKLSRFQERRFVAKPIDIRGKHLVSKWRVYKNKTLQRCRRKQITGSKKSSELNSVDKVEEQEGFLLFNNNAVGASALSSSNSYAVSDLPTTSFASIPVEDSHQSPLKSAVQASGSSNEATDLAEKERIPKRAIARRDRFDPLDVRASIAPVHALQRLTVERDIEGLRALLNECRWPNIQSVRPFINDLFQVFIDRASDVDEIKFLMWDFAATDNRAFVADSVILSFLERVIREEGLLSASAYAKQHRDLFLVRPPMERRRKTLVAIYNKLFATALKSSVPGLGSARSFVDLLTALGYIGDDNGFFNLLLAEELERSNFETAYQLWCSNAKNYRTSNGMHLLIRSVLKKMDTDAQKKNLDKLFEFSLQYNHPYTAFGELVVELIIANQLAEAEMLMKKLTVSGRHLRIPLERLKGNSSNLVVIERMSEVVTNCMFVEQDFAFRKKALKDTLFNPALMDSISQYLVTKWSVKKKRKFVPPNQRLKKFILDPVQMHQLTMCIQEVWTELADISNDIPSLCRMYEWCSKHGVELEKFVLKRCKGVYERNGQECLFLHDHKTS